MQYLKRALTSRDVKLVSRPTLEGATTVRTNLRSDTERAQKTERPTRDGRVDDVQMDGDLAASSEMHAAGGVEEPGQLGQAITRAARRDSRELMAEVFRQ